MERHTVRQGFSLEFEVTFRDADGNPVVGYTGAEALTLVIWSGENRQAITASNSTVTWLDPNAPTATVHVDQLDTPALAGRYDLVVKIADGGDLVEGYECELFVELAAGSDAAPSTYGGRADMLAEVPWLEMMQPTPSQTGYAREQGLARDWADQRILSACPFDRDWVATQLAANKLLLTGADGRRLVRAVSLYAAGLVLEREPGKQGDRTYRDMGRELKGDAESLLSAGLVWLDTNGDGVGDYGIHVGVRHLLRA